MRKRGMWKSDSNMLRDSMLCNFCSLFMQAITARSATRTAFRACVGAPPQAAQAGGRAHRKLRKQEGEPIRRTDHAFGLARVGGPRSAATGGGSAGGGMLSGVVG
jgi:hypothetical protein